uniref:Uncharacterized protein n=1 Tax=Quercus lobata TaxID=97700 RepID=A0A7N2LL23_QUELO
MTQHVMKLRHLQSLQLDTTNDFEAPRDLRLKRLSGLENLSRLCLHGRIDNPFFIINTNYGLSQSLTYLKLVRSCLSEDPMHVLQKLRNLRYLWLLNSYTGKTMECDRRGFPLLLVLKFEKLGELEDFYVHEQAMQKLVGFEIDTCRSLKIPGSLKQLKTLHQWKLTKMPNMFTKTIKETKGKIWNNLAESPAIIVNGEPEPMVYPRDFEVVFLSILYSLIL